MKKNLLALLLLAVMVLPVFANDDVDMELIPKVGYLFSPEITIDGNSNSKDSAISVGADFYFDLKDSDIAIGLGLAWADNTKVASNNDNKIGFTNVYAAIKYKLLANSNQDDPLYFYPLGQIGFGSASYEITAVSSVDVESGLYWGLGLGAEYKSVIFEVLYGCNYATIKIGNESKDLSYAGFRINVGYKFAL